METKSTLKRTDLSLTYAYSNLFTIFDTVNRSKNYKNLHGKWVSYPESSVILSLMTDKWVSPKIKIKWALCQ
jgi:hypothetical protein